MPETKNHKYYYIEEKNKELRYSLILFHYTIILSKSKSSNADYYGGTGTKAQAACWRIPMRFNIRNVIAPSCIYIFITICLE